MKMRKMWEVLQGAQLKILIPFLISPPGREDIIWFQLARSINIVNTRDTRISTTKVRLRWEPERYGICNAIPSSAISMLCPIKRNIVSMTARVTILGQN